MKLRKVMMLLVIMMVGFMIMPDVHAAYDFEQDNNTQSKQIKKLGGNGTKTDPYRLQLIDTAVQDFHIKPNSNIHVVIDLNGQKLTNFTENNSVIFIEDSNSSVTIEDSSNGSGEIELQNFSAEVPVINNAGTLVINGGTIHSNNNSGNRSTGIYNSGNLTITGGTVKTESDTAWGITNVGTAVINGGTFNQDKKLAMIMNSADLTINNGEFVASGNEGQEAMITNDPGEEGTGNVIAKITGGDFQTQNVIYEEGRATTEISGGTYANTDSIAKYIANGYEIKDGKIVKEEQPVAPAEAVEKNVDTSDINLALIISVLVLGVCGVAYTIKKKFY